MVFLEENADPPQEELAGSETELRIRARCQRKRVLPDQPQTTASGRSTCEARDARPTGASTRREDAPQWEACSETARSEDGFPALETALGKHPSPRH